jgi:hypothetical protein
MTMTVTVTLIFIGSFTLSIGHRVKLLKTIDHRIRSYEDHYPIERTDPLVSSSLSISNELLNLNHDDMTVR